MAHENELVITQKLLLL